MMTDYTIFTTDTFPSRPVRIRTNGKNIASIVVGLPGWDTTDAIRGEISIMLDLDDLKNALLVKNLDV